MVITCRLQRLNKRMYGYFVGSSLVEAIAVLVMHRIELKLLDIQQG